MKRISHLFEPVRSKKGNHKETNGSSEDDGEGGCMQDLLSPVLVGRKVSSMFQVGVDEHEGEGSQSTLHGGLQGRSQSENCRAGLGPSIL